MSVLDQMICFSLYSSAQAIQKAYRPLLDELGLTYPQYLVLTVMWEAGEPLSVGALGRILHLESNTLTPLLKRMELAGLIKRYRTKDDERRVEVALTEEGHAMHGRAAHIPGCIEQCIGLPTDQLFGLTEQIGKVAKQLRTPG